MIAMRVRRYAVGAGMVAAIVLPGLPAAHGVEDVLQRPALLSPETRTVLMLGGGRAGDRLVAVGERGTVLLSDDEGRTWRQAEAVPVSVTLTAVDFISSQVGWATGHSGVVLKTRDGGETWTMVLDGRAAAQVFAEGLRRLAGRAGDERSRVRLHRAADRMLEDGPDKPFLDVDFEDEAHGLIVGAYGLFLATDDGGRTWTSWDPRLDNRWGSHLYDVDLAGRRVLIAGERGAVFLSPDGGERFSRLEPPYDGTFFGGLMAPDGALLLYGLRGNLWRAGPDGDAWTRVETQGEHSINGGLVGTDGTIWLADQGGGVHLSRDGGLTFKRVAVRKSPISSLLETSDGGLVLLGVGGPQRVSAQALGEDLTR